MDRYFLNSLESVILPVFFCFFFFFFFFLPWGFVCVCVLGHISDQAGRQFAISPLSLTAWLLLTSKLALCENLVPSQFFPEHSYNLSYVHGLLYSQEFMKTFQYPYEHIPYLFFLRMIYVKDIFVEYRILGWQLFSL